VKLQTMAEIQQALEAKDNAAARLREYERLTFERDRLKGMLEQPRSTAQADERVLRQLIELTQRISPSAYTSNVPRRTLEDLVAEFGEGLGKTLFEISRDMRGFPSMMQARTLVLGALFTALERSKRIAAEEVAREEQLTAQLAPIEKALEEFQQ
jgi:hypothetical protein